MSLTVKINNFKSEVIGALDNHVFILNMIRIPVRLIRYAKNSIKKRPSFSKLILEKTDDGSFFGYYDIPFDKNNILYNKILGDNSIQLIKKENDGLTYIDQVNSWNYQQGCMYQSIFSIPDCQLIYNTIHKGSLVSCVFSFSGQKSYHPYPVSLMSNDGWYSLNYKRLTYSEYGYKYPDNVDNFHRLQSDEEDGIWYYSHKLNQAKLIIKISDLNRDFPRAGNKKDKGFINHLSQSRDYRYLIFIHRIISVNEGRISRLMLYNVETDTIGIILDEGFVSHYCWISSSKFVIYARVNNRKGYYIYDTNTLQYTSLLNGDIDQYGDGHPTASACGRYIVTDSYPDASSHQKLILVDLLKENHYILASLYVPFWFFGENRCDLHPRWSTDDSCVSFDSSHSGTRCHYTANIKGFLDDL